MDEKVKATKTSILNTSNMKRFRIVIRIILVLSFTAVMFQAFGMYMQPERVFTRQLKITVKLINRETKKFDKYQARADSHFNAIQGLEEHESYLSCSIDMERAKRGLQKTGACGLIGWDILGEIDQHLQ